MRMSLALSMVVAAMVAPFGATAFARAPQSVEPPAGRDGDHTGAAHALRPAVTREDMARAYLHFDTAFAKLAARGLSDERREDISRSFDAVTMLFFGAKLDAAMVQLNTLTASCMSDDPATRTTIAGVLNQHVEFAPRLVVAGGASTVTVAMRPIGDAEAIDPATLAIDLVGPGGEVAPHAGAATWSLAGNPAPRPGRYRAVVTPRGVTEALPMGGVQVVGESPEAVAKRLRTKAEEFEAKQLGRERDRAAFASRIGLLTSKPSTTKSAQFLADQATLMRDLAMEAAAIERGESFWKGRRGDDWRTIRAVAIDTPCRVHVPESLAADAKPALVIALHGAGGDESMFMDGYGAGAIRRMAAERGFVVVAPLTTTIATTPVVFDAIVEEMVFAANVDPERVFVVGHSLGAMATSRLAELRGSRIAGIAMLAGGGAGKASADQPPTMLCAGGLDPLFPIQRMRESNVALSEALGAAKVAYAYREYPHDGHTLMVSAALPDAIEWLLALPRRAQAAPAQPAPR